MNNKTKKTLADEVESMVAFLNEHGYVSVPKRKKDLISELKTRFSFTSYMCCIVNSKGKLIHFSNQRYVTFIPENGRWKEMDCGIVQQ